MVNFVHMVCKIETRDKIMTECIEEYTKHHPIRKNKTITQEEILNHLASFYLDPYGTQRGNNEFSK